ncbi:M61 glycyl aminopeptidase [Plakobranchus ocellatus]|uniref:M61 glycyl aminopeptidase n=1 Tax=Plakobranchus ocellatus TaxID=259542 RepID=A0AAV4C7H6_9GAST|nr:M61 glycyl aminopeptidase [Plakobranchus ocellatus]
MAVPFATLYQGSGASVNRTTPLHDETWRANFLRAQWSVKKKNTRYEKDEGSNTDWWVWQSPEVTNVHLPERWGLLQFQDAEVNGTHFMTSEKWVATNALLDTYSALQAFHAVTGRYTDRKELLHLPPYVFSGKCVDDVNIKLDWSGFHVTIKPKGDNLEDGHIRTDHFLWFGREDMQYF